MPKSRDLSKCATEHGYNRYTYGCRCEVCSAAKAKYVREKRAAARAYASQARGRTVIPDIKHGIWGYQERMCRCDVCIDAKRAASRRQYHATRARPA